MARRARGGGRAVTPLGLGCATLGNLYTEVSDEDAHATVRTAWELGVRDFDTAPHYGLGLSERRLGAALRRLGAEDARVSTKAGRLLEPNPDYTQGMLDPDLFAVPATHLRRWDGSADGLRRSLHESLERLGVDRIDTLYLHDPDQFDFDQALRVGLPTLVTLREEGLVVRVGVGSNDEQALARCLDAADLDVVMCAGRYTLLEQAAALSLLPLCAERGVGYVAAGVYNSGALASAQLPRAITYDYAPASQPVLDRLRVIHQVCADHGVSVPHAAVQFVARHPAVSMVVVGARSPEEVRAAHEYTGTALPAALWRDLRAAAAVAAGSATEDSATVDSGTEG